MNWLIVTAVAVLGAIFISQAMLVPQAVSTMRARRYAKNDPMQKGTAQSASADDAGSFNA